MITINKIIPQTVALFSPDGTFIGDVNEYEFNDVRIQIKKEQAEGYYCMFNDKRFNINKDGRSNDWFEGFFDLFEKQLREII